MQNFIYHDSLVKGEQRLKIMSHAQFRQSLRFACSIGVFISFLFFIICAVFAIIICLLLASNCIFKDSEKLTVSNKWPGPSC